MPKHLSFSLIVPTLGRSLEIQALFDSLKNQSYKNFDLIIVDQNDDNRVLKIVENNKSTLDIIYIRSKIKGLSANRNLGINYAHGQILCFPDDDCTYEQNTLKKVNNFFNLKPNMNIYSCGVKDLKLNKRFNMPLADSLLSGYNYFNKAISIGIFIKVQNKSDIVFDEKLGVGSVFGSAEESDLISSLLMKGYKGKYFANDFVYHAYPSVIPNKQRYLQYGMGYGALMKKEIILRRKFYFIFPFLFEIIGRLLFSIFPSKKRKFFYASLIGRLKGFIGYKIEK